MSSPHMNFVLFATLMFLPKLSAGTVTNPADSGPGSLRALLAGAASGEIIDFHPSLNGETITLETNLAIEGKELTVDASTLPAGISVSGNHQTRIFMITANSIVTLKRLTLRDGRAASGNGGALLVQGQLPGFGILTMTDCSVIGSYALNNGGGAFFGGIQVTLDRCSFSGNRGDDFGGGIAFTGTSSATVTNSIISGNRSTNGGGIYNLNDHPTIVNCTIQGNSGGGIQNGFSSAPKLINSILWGNRFGTGPEPAARHQMINGSNSQPEVSYCLIEGASSSLSFSDGNRVIWGANNLSGIPGNDPKFIAPVPFSSAPNTGGDLRVFPDSPVFNIGFNASNSTPLDRAGKVRIAASVIDLGAFETGYVTYSYLHPSLSRTGDENLNGRSNFLEYASGADPVAPHDPTVIPAISRSGGYNFLSYTERNNAADVSSKWETSTDLETNSWQTMVQGIDYTVDSTSSPTPGRQEVDLKLPDGGPRRFYRQVFSSKN